MPKSSDNPCLSTIFGILGYSKIAFNSEAKINVLSKKV